MNNKQKDRGGKKIGESIHYKPTYKLVNVHREECVTNSGENIEIIGYYRADEHMIPCPPNYDKVVSRVLKLLKGTGISKLTITFLNQNLEDER